MFNNKSNKENGPSSKGNDAGSSSINLIGAGTVIEGDIRSNGDIRIDGAGAEPHAHGGGDADDLVAVLAALAIGALAGG